MRMRVSFRSRIFACVLLATLGTLALPLYYARVTLHDDLLAQAGQQALHEVRLLAQLLEKMPQQEDIPQYIREVGDPSWRLSLIAKDGHVLADSAITKAHKQELDNHADRPEVRAALAAGEGFSTRYSNTLHNEMVYAASRLDNGTVLRIAVPLAGHKDRTEAMLAPLTGVVLGAGAISLLLALFLSRWLRRDLAQMVHVVEAISYGKYRRLHLYPGGEFAPLADAVNRMAQNIEEHLDTVAEQNELLESILDTMDNGVLVLDPRGRIRRYNRAFAQAFPAVTGSAGAQVVEVIPNPTLQRAVEGLLHVPTTTRRDTAHLHWEDTEGRCFAVHLGRALADAPTLGVVAVFHDVTDMVRLERVRRDFVANVSHELRTPLTAIQGYAETLSTLDNAPEQCRHFAAIICRHGAYLSVMVEDLLTLARLESGDGTDKTLPLTPLPAKETLVQASTLCRPLLEAKNLRLECDIAPHLTVMGDMATLTKIFRNLLENACRHAPIGSRIRIIAQGADTMAQFCVCDDGPGIAPADLLRVFERFYRVEKHRGGENPSSGLGLAICKHSVERLGGRIWAQSPAHDCATALCFTLRLAQD